MDTFGVYFFYDSISRFSSNTLAIFQQYQINEVKLHLLATKKPIDIELLPNAWNGHRDFAEWLIRLTKPEVIVDLGLECGYSTFVMANPNIGIVYGIDTFLDNAVVPTRQTPEAFEIVINVLNTNNYENVKIVSGTREMILSQWEHPIDILHIAGYHTYDEMSINLILWSQLLRSTNSIILMHDIEIFPGVRRLFFENSFHKYSFVHSGGFGVISGNLTLLKIIDERFKSCGQDL
jgi:hypothetical protein